MKNYILIAAAAFTLLTACKDPKQDEAVVRQRDSLMAIIDERESSVNDFIASFNDVEANLDSVSRRQHIIRINSDKNDLKANQKERINSEIKAINDLMSENNKKLKELSNRLSRSSKKNSQLEKTIELLRNQLNQKYRELSELQERLNFLDAQITQLRTQVDTLNNLTASQTQRINEQTTELHTAYYIVGTSKELEKAKLIDKKGGLLGIGRTSRLSDDLDNAMFTKIDYTETTTIPINSKDAKIITSHPSDSYSWDKSGKTINSIVINDPAKFWSSSKYLVITN